MKLFSWFKKQLFGNELDELQQQKADQIGHRGFWLAWWLLLISLLAQSIAGAPMSQMAAEWVVFMTMCVYGAVEWIRNGIWTIADSRPSLRKNLVWSAAAAVAFFIYLLVRNSRQSWWEPGDWWGAAVGGAVTGLLCLGMLQLGSWLYYKRRRTLDNPEDDTPDDDTEEKPQNGPDDNP